MLELSEKDMLQVLQGAGEVSGKAQRWDSLRNVRLEYEVKNRALAQAG